MRQLAVQRTGGADVEPSTYQTGARTGWTRCDCGRAIAPPRYSVPDNIVCQAATFRSNARRAWALLTKASAALSAGMATYLPIILAMKKMTTAPKRPPPPRR